MSTPATRTIEGVLRTALAPGNDLRILVGEYAAPPADNARYAHITINGQALTVPNLNGAQAGAAGDPAYVLADNTRMWVLGTVTPTAGAGTPGPAGPTGPAGPAGAAGATGPSGASTFLSGAGAPTAGQGVDGSIYLDTTSRRMWGPKAAGAWPAAAFGRVMPLNPTYAQLTSG